MFRKLAYWSNFTVVRWQLLTVVLIYFAINGWLLNEYKNDYSSDSFLVLSKTFLPVLLWTGATLFAICILTAVSSWLFFILRFRRKKISVHLKFGDGDHALAGDVPFEVIVRGGWRPFLGTIRAKLVFTGMKLSSPVLLDRNDHKKGGGLIRQSISGKGFTFLNDRGIYDVEEVQLQFCDMLRFIALPYTVQANKQFYTLPLELKESVIPAHPNATEEQKHRIEIPKRVQGEYLNYKDFESGDDVRRIVWKIYAKSGELVVRIPEVMDPYASHLYFYASFYHPQTSGSTDRFEMELLNRYKDKVGNILEALKKNGFEVRMPHDQETPKLQGMSEKHNELFHVASANWQTDRSPFDFVSPRNAAFVSVSSLTPVDEIAKMLEHLPQYVPVVAVRMSDAIPSVFRMKWKNLIFKNEIKPADRLKSTWLLSPLRSKLSANEKAISLLFKQRGNAFLIESGAGS